MKREDSLYTKYTLSDEEFLDGTIFTELQLAVLVTERTLIAERKVSLPYLPDNPFKYATEQEYCRGQIEILTFLIDRAEQSKLRIIASNSPENLQ
jgi:hypothetical protein